MRKLLLVIGALVVTLNLFAQDNAGTDCISCHHTFKAGGTVYGGFNGGMVSSSYTFIQFIKDDGFAAVV